MKSHFYLYNKSFTYIPGKDAIELGSKIEDLAILCAFIRANNDNIYRHDSIYEEIFFETVTLATVLYDSDNAFLSRDQRKALVKIINHSKPCALSMMDVVSLLPTHDENNTYGLICFNEVADVEKQYLVYSKAEWFAFHRIFLGLYPIAEAEFVVACCTCFPAIYFHERIPAALRSLEKGLGGFAKEIVRCLSALNDEFRLYYDPADRVGSLRKFQAACNLEVTPEGNISRKKDFTFDFLNTSGILEAVCCEPHIKMYKSDDSGDSHHYSNRLYFHEGKPNIASGKILVGHIGKHL